VDYLKISFPK